jgi:mono/diheme cytochrome c family protein
MKPTNFRRARMLVLAVGGAMLVGRGAATGQDKRATELKKVPITESDPRSGAQLYKEYCSACHGMEGKGDGPVSRFLKGPPADLRTLAQRNNGKYPADYVASTLRFGTDSAAHGTSDMPIWGPVFRAQKDKQKNKKGADLRIQDLTEFVESLQQK